MCLVQVLFTFNPVGEVKEVGEVDCAFLLTFNAVRSKPVALHEGPDMEELVGEGEGRVHDLLHLSKGLLSGGFPDGALTLFPDAFGDAVKAEGEGEEEANEDCDCDFHKQIIEVSPQRLFVSRGELVNQFTSCYQSVVWKIISL